MGTVYRNLKKFCENGKIRSIGVINGQEHFDANVHKHAHFICEKCGQVEDIHESFSSALHLDDIADKYGIYIKEAEIVFNGICKECMAKEQKEIEKTA